MLHETREGSEVHRRAQEPLPGSVPAPPALLYRATAFELLRVCQLLPDAPALLSGLSAQAGPYQADFRLLLLHLKERVSPGLNPQPVPPPVAQAVLAGLAFRCHPDSAGAKLREVRRTSHGPSLTLWNVFSQHGMGCVRQLVESGSCNTTAGLPPVPSRAEREQLVELIDLTMLYLNRLGRPAWQSESYMLHEYGGADEVDYHGWAQQQRARQPLREPAASAALRQCFLDILAAAEPKRETAEAQACIYRLRQAREHALLDGQVQWWLRA